MVRESIWAWLQGLGGLCQVKKCATPNKKVAQAREHYHVGQAVW